MPKEDYDPGGKQVSDKLYTLQTAGTERKKEGGGVRERERRRRRKRSKKGSFGVNRPAYDQLLCSDVTVHGVCEKEACLMPAVMAGWCIVCRLHGEFFSSTLH